MSTEIKRYDPDQEWRTNGMYEWPDGDYVLFSDHQKALAAERDLLFGVVTERNELQLKLAEEYGRGVTAGKKEALHYSPSEREYYGKHVAQNDCWKDLKKQLSEAEKIADFRSETIEVATQAMNRMQVNFLALRLKLAEVAAERNRLKSELKDAADELNYLRKCGQASL